MYHLYFSMQIWIEYARKIWYYRKLISYINWKFLRCNNEINCSLLQNIRHHPWSIRNTYERWTIVDKESTIYNRLDLPAYTSGNTFSFLVYEGRDKRFDPPCEMSRKQFSQQNRTRYELPFLLSFLCLLDSSMAWSMVRPAALFTSSVTRVSLSLENVPQIFTNF